MKARMKKLVLLTTPQHQEHTIDQLQELGLVHVAIDGEHDASGIADLEKNISRIEKAIQILEKYEAPAGRRKTKDDSGNWAEALDQILAQEDAIDDKYQQIEQLEKESKRLDPWGSFSWKRIHDLREKGIAVNFYTASKKLLDQHPLDDTPHQIVNEIGETVYLVVIGTKPESVTYLQQVELSEKDQQAITQEITDLQKERKQLRKKIAEYFHFLPRFAKELKRLEFEKMASEVRAQLTTSGETKILTLQGWFPEETEEQLITHLNNSEETYLIETPGKNEPVPVQLKNPGYIRLFEPITRIFQLPNYHEVDLTPVIAVFYPIFFAYCLGDAGYGFVLLVLSVVGAFTLFKNNRQLAFLGIILGLFTFVMGFIKSGSLFGIPLTTEETPAFLKDLGKLVVIPDDQDVVMNAFNVSLLIGVIQIYTGVFSSIYKKWIYEKPVAAVPQIGKLLIITGAIVYFLGGMQGSPLFAPYTGWAQILLLAGILLVVLFHNLEMNVIKRVGSGLLPLFFIFTGLLGDVLSYVRLFALGVASSVLGLVVNQIGEQIMANGWWGVVIGILFLLAGHALNFLLASLGAFVHPLRLTFVEFYNNAQFEGGGFDYNPFKKYKAE